MPPECVEKFANVCRRRRAVAKAKPPPQLAKLMFTGVRHAKARCATTCARRQAHVHAIRSHAYFDTMPVGMKRGPSHRLVNPLRVRFAKRSFLPVDTHSNVDHFLLLVANLCEDI